MVRASQPLTTSVFDRFCLIRSISQTLQLSTAPNGNCGLGGNKRFNYGAVLTVIKMYKYMVDVEIFVIVNCGASQQLCRNIYIFFFRKCYVLSAIEHHVYNFKMIK